VALSLRGMTILTSRVVSTTGNAVMTSLGGSAIAISGDGAAVFDLVLAVPPGSVPGVSMCKNYLGPATVTLLRTTDGSTTAASHTNSGSATATIQGCENPSSFEIDREALVGPTRWPERMDPRPLVLANYYPWYGTGLAPLVRDRPTGPVDTDDPAAVDAAIAAAAAAGIDGFIVEYEGSPTHEADVDEAFRAADRRPGFHSALMLDFDIMGNRWGWTGPDLLDRVLGEVNRLSAHTSYLEVGGLPVVFLYGTQRLDPQQWSAALDRLNRATGTRLFVVTDDQRIPSPGMYAYSTNTAMDEATLRSWSHGMLLERHARPGLVDAPRSLWVAPVSPGYDDTALGRARPNYVDRAGGARYDQTWSAAMGSLPDWIMVTTWNEYFEQTHVVPGTTTGNLALEQTTAWSARFHAEG
jgi:hypothetical protein